MSESDSVIFCDFDGTLARRDVGYHMYHHFTNGRCDELIPDWKAGRLSTRECLLKESEWFRGTTDDVFRFLDTFELNPGFDELLRYAAHSDIAVTIISDGLDLYIHYLLKRHGISGLNILCNHGRIEGDRLIIEFPYADPHNTGGGVCKGDRIAEHRHQQKRPVSVIFVGDGLSDIDALAETDILFAKKDLAQYCDQRNIPYTAFDTFKDVTRELIARSLFVR